MISNIQPVAFVLPRKSLKAPAARFAKFYDARQRLRNKFDVVAVHQYHTDITEETFRTVCDTYPEELKTRIIQHLDKTRMVMAQEMTRWTAYVGIVRRLRTTFDRSVSTSRELIPRAQDLMELLIAKHFFFISARI